MGEYPQNILEEHQQLSTLVVELGNRFKDGITFHVIDSQSLPGIFKSMRYRVRKYPTFIIGGKESVVGFNQVALDHALETRSSSQETLSMTR